jgi:hypothetical protein
MCFWRELGGQVAKVPCAICGGLDPENIYKPGDLCDGCWYGMRLDPDWAERMAESGVKVEYQGGCVPIPGGIACRDPYKAGS